MKKILVPVDLSPCSEAALDYAIPLARKIDCAVEVLHVLEPPRYVPPEAVVHVQGSAPTPFHTYAREYVERELKALISKRQVAGTPPLEVHVRSGHPFETIVEAANGGDYEMIVMGTHGRTGMKHMLVGSVTESVIRACRCPVLAIREKP